MTRPRVLIGAFCLLVAAWLAATAVLFFWPDEDSPTRADAVVVLAGSRGQRLEAALRLMRRGVAPVLVISDGFDPSVPAANRLCASGAAGFEVLCFRPEPYSTRGEAEDVATIAARHGWRSLVLVTSDYHVTRARILFERCFPGRVEAVGIRFPRTSLPSLVVSEWAKLVYALAIDRSC